MDWINGFGRVTPGFRSGSANRVGLGSGVATLKVVSEPRFRGFYKMIMKNDFENFYDIHCMCI